MAINREEIANRILAMPSNLVKAAVLRWLETPGSLDDLEQTLSEKTIEGEGNDWEWSDISATLQFTPLTEQQMFRKSLDSLEEYRRTGQGMYQKFLYVELSFSMVTGKLTGFALFNPVL